MAREPEPDPNGPPDSYYFTDEEVEVVMCEDCEEEEPEEGYDRCTRCNAEWLQESAEQNLEGIR